MADAVFFDILPRFDWAASEAGQKKLIGQFDSAAKHISRTFGVEAGNAATQATEKIAADMRGMQEAVARATTAATDDYRRMILAQGDLQASTLRVVEAVEKGTAESSRYAAALARQEAAIVKADAASNAYAASTARETAAIAAATAAHGAHAAAVESSGAKAAALATANRVGMASTIAFGAAIYETNKQSIEFESSQQRLIASAGESRQGLQTVSDGILKMAGDVGYSAGQISEAAYNVEKMGFRGRDALQVLGSGAQLAKAENADLADTIKGLTITMHDFQTPVEQAADVASKLNVAAGASSGTLQEFSESLHSVEPLAASLHIRMEDLFGTMAMASKSGASLDQVTENTRNALNSLSNAQGPAREAMAQLGINAQDVSEKLGQRGLAGTMQYLADTAKSKLDPNNLIPVGEFKENAQAAQDAADMMTKMSPAAAEVAQQFANGAISRKDFTGAVKAANATDASQLQQFGALELKLDGFSSRFKNGQSIVETYNQALKDMTGTVAGQSIALQVVDGHAKDTNDLISKLGATTRETDGTVKGFDETLETQKMQWDKTKAAMGAAAIELGDDLLPIMTAAGQAIAAVTKFLADHKAILDTLVITVGSLGAAWVVTKAAMALGSLVSSLRTGFATIGGFVTGLIGKYDALAVSATAAADAEELAAGAGAGGFARGAAAGGAARGALPFIGVAGGAALGVGTLAYGATQASDAFNSYADSHPEVERHDNQGRTPGQPGYQGGGREGGNRQGLRNTPVPAGAGRDGGRGRAVPMNDAARAAAARSNDAQAAVDGGVNAAAAAAAAARPDVTSPAGPLAADAAVGGGGGSKPPKGDKLDPLYMAPAPQMTAAYPTGRNGKGDGLGGTGGETGSSILGGGFEFTPAGIGKFTTALLANLAMGNPIGKMLAEKGSQTNPLYVSVVDGQGGLGQQLLGLGGSGGGVGGSAGMGMGPAGPGAEGWRNTVAQIVAKYGPQVGIPASQYDNWTNAMVRQIQTESGGNPNADNPNDTDGRGGRQHVRGLLQYLPSSYAGSGGRLTGISDMMSPEGQIAGLLMSQHTASGGPAAIGHGVGWGPNTSMPINRGAAPAVPTTAAGLVGNGPLGPILGGDGAALPIFGGGGGGMGMGMPDSPVFPTAPGSGGLQIGGGASSIAARNAGFGAGAYGNRTQIGGGAHIPGQNAPSGVPGMGLAMAGANAGPGPSAASQAQSAVRPSSVADTQQYGAGQAVGSGFTSNIGSTILAAAGPMAAMAPGSAQAAKLADRTIGYLGQLGGIAASAPLETFLPSGAGDALANPSKSWFGKLALGVAGAHKADGGGENRAGQSAPPVKDQGDPAAQQAKAAAPAAQMPDQQHKGGGQSAGPGNNGSPVVGQLTVNTTNGVDTDAMTRDLTRYQGGGGR